MQDVLERIVRIEGDADKIILSAREEAAALLAQGDAQNAAKLKEVKKQERERVASGMAEIEASQAAEIKEAIKTAEGRFQQQAQSVPVGKLAEMVANRISRTVFDP